MASWTLTGSTTSSTYWKCRAVVTEVSQNVANNTTSLKVSLQLGRAVVSSYLYSYNTNYYINIGSDSSGTQSISTWTWDPATAGSWKEIASRTVTVSHNADGTKSVNISAKWYNTGVTPSEATVSGSVTLTTIPRATTPTTPINATMGSSVTISLPRASSSFTHKLTYTFGNASGTISNSAGASVSWTPPLSLANQVPNATSGTGTITCKTYSGSTLIGTKSVSFKASVPSSVVPTISSVSISENTSGISAQFGGYVQSKSTLKVVTSASGARGSTISKIAVTVNGKSYSGASVTTSALTSSGTLSVVTKVTDSRGRTATNTQSISVLAYSAPSGSVSGLRSDDLGTADPNGEYLLYNYRFTISPVGNNNTKLVQLQYKQTASSSWTVLLTDTSTYSDTVSGGLSASNILNADYPYNLRLMIQDYFTTVYINAADIPTAFTLVDYHNSGKGIAFGKVAENADLFDCALPSLFQAASNPIIDAAHGIANIGAYVQARRTDTGNSVSLGVGSGGINHGVYSGSLNRWLIYGDASTVYVNESEFPTAVHTSTIANIITAATDITIIEAEVYTYGKLCQLRIRWKYGQDKNVPANGNISNITVGTLNSAFRPCMTMGAWSSGDQAGAAWYNITGGVVALGACEGIGSSYTIAAGTEFRLFTTYILA